MKRTHREPRTMTNTVKDRIASFWQSLIDTLGWVTALTLLGETFWIRVPDMYLFYTLLPVFLLMMGLPIFEIIFPHRCNEDCGEECVE